MFFVALSRARDFLFLSRAERYSASQSASPSKFLSPINALAPAARRNDSPLPARPARTLAPPGVRTLYQERELSLYIQCPQRYQFEALDGLRAIRDNSPYVRFHRCVFRTIGWLETQRAAGTPSDLPTALTQLAQEWAVRGPKGHGCGKPPARASRIRIPVRMQRVPPHAGNRTAVGRRHAQASAGPTLARGALYRSDRIQAGVEVRPMPLPAVRPHVDRGPRRLDSQAPEPTVAAATRHHLLPGAAL